MSLVLEVSAPPVGDPEGANVTHTYTDVELIRVMPAFASEFEIEKVTQPNAALKLPIFLGVSDYFDLPEGDWRARVTFNGVEVLNGRCRRVEIEREAVSGQFVVKVIDDATDRAQALLKGVRLNDLPEAQFDDLTYINVRALIRTEFKPNTTRDNAALSYMKLAGYIRAYHLLSVVEQTMIAAGLLGAPADLFDFTVTVDDGGDAELTRPAGDSMYLYSLQGYAGEVTETETTLLFTPSSYTPNSVTLPTWDGWTLIENVARMCARTFSASYGAFPSEQVTVEMIEDAWAETPDLPAVDALWDRQLYTLHRDDPWKDDLAVTFERQDELPDIITWGTGMPHIATDDNQIDQFWTPPPYAVVAAERWAFSEGNSPIAGETVDLDFTLAPCAWYGDEPFEEVAAVDVSAGGVTATETQVWGYPCFTGLDDERAYLAVMRQEPDGARGVLMYRQLDDPGTGQLPFVNETWAPAVFANYRLSRAERDVIEGNVIPDGVNVTVGSLRPGYPAEGVEFAGRAFLIERVERRTGGPVLSIRGSRPVALPSPKSDQPYFVGPVTNLKGVNVDVENAISPEKEYHRITWDWPAAGAGRASKFEVQRYDFASTLWVQVDPTIIRGRRVFDFAWSDANDSYGERHSAYRVRAVMEEAAGVGDTYGPWTEARIYF